MVLATPPGGAEALGAPRLSRERGSQTLELGMLLPAVALLVVLVAHAGILGSDVVAAQLLAREAARAAAVEGPEAAEETLAEAAGTRPFALDIEPEDARPGQLVVASVRVRSAAFAAFGIEVWLPARAAMRTERR